MAEKTDPEVASDGLPSVNIATIDKRWISHDLQILRSGLFADAEIVCQGDSTPRKVHRNILAGRSAWFKKAFFGDFTSKEAIERKVNLEETSWHVDLMLYFFYTGGIDLKDEALTNGHDVMEISVELLRLGGTFQSEDMRLHGYQLLLQYLSKLLCNSCDTKADAAKKEAWFKANIDFPKNFCSAVVNAFNKDRPVKSVQKVLADFAFAARTHLFKNEEFLSFVKEEVVPEFGNLVLTALMTGSVSDAFKGHYVFKQWQDWQVTPTASQPQPQIPNLCGGGSPGVATGSRTAASRALPLGSDTPAPVASSSPTARSKGGDAKITRKRK